MTTASGRPAGNLDRSTRAGWLLVGFAVGGFFDGIVLHQILQWPVFPKALAAYSRGDSLRRPGDPPSKTVGIDIIRRQVSGRPVQQGGASTNQGRAVFLHR